MIVAQRLTSRAHTSTVRLAYDVSLVAAGSLFISLAAQLSIPLPFTPVPLTGQTLAVLLVGALLGRWRGLAAVSAYLIEGISGLPVFAGAAAGPAHLFGPTGGYLIGFLPAALVTGHLAERGWDQRVWTTALAMTSGTLIILFSGAAWLSVFVGPANAAALGILPFLTADALKIAVAALLLPALRRLI